VGADLANIVNEAALLAVRNDREQVIQEDFEEAIEKVMAGLKKKNKLINKEERKRVAYHEIGHAMTAYLTEGADVVEKISIIPRGFGALGYTLQLPTEERYLLTEKELLGRIDVLLGGRAVEEIIFGDISTGASDDVSKATEIVRSMITEYGMSETFKNVYLSNRRSAGYADRAYALTGPGNREYSEATQEYIDNEIARIISQRYLSVTNLLGEHRQLIEQLAEELMQKETLGREEFAQFVGSAKGR
jgi:cell division protease FtsH